MNPESVDTSRAWFFPDLPVGSEDADAFGHRDLANNLESAIRHNKGRVMIGLLGGFGVGKSSIIQLLQARLRGHRPVLRISAERHEVSEFHRAFVFAFAEATQQAKLLSRKQIEEELQVLNYSSSQQMSDIRLSPAVRALNAVLQKFAGSVARRALILSGASLAIVIASFFVTLALGATAVEDIWTWLVGAIAIATATPIVASLIAIASGTLPAFQAALKPGLFNRLRPRVEAADEYERVFARLVEMIDEDIVVAIDDIDRLGAEDVLSALNAIRSFQLTCTPQPAFIVSADEEVIARAIQHSPTALAGATTDTNDVVSEYLSRLFTHRQQIPPHAFADLRAYARDCLTNPPHPALPALESNLDAVVQVLIYDGVTNPRHVIRLLNAFLADFRLAMLREQRLGVQSIAIGTVTSNPRTVARLTVLRIDFPKFFQSFASDLDLLQAVEDVARGTSSPTTSLGLVSMLGYESLTDSRYKAVQAYISRTAGWVEAVDDLLPFIYLGQDEVDRSVGSANVRRVKSMLTNGLVADFVAYITNDEAQRNRQGLLSWIKATVDSLDGPELANALQVLDGAASDPSTVEWLTGLAEVVAPSARRLTEPPLTVRGLGRLSGSASGTIQTTLQDLLIRSNTADLDWNLELIRERPFMNTRLAADTGMRERIKGSLATVANKANIEQLAQLEEALLNAANADVGESIISAVLDLLSRVDQDATASTHAMVGELVKRSGMQLALSPLISSIRHLTLSPGSTSCLIALQVMASIGPVDDESLANLTFDLTLKTRTEDEFNDGVNEAFLAASAPVLLRALKQSHAWLRGMPGNKVSLPDAVGQLLASGTAQFSWINDFTQPLVLALRDFPSALSPLTVVVADALQRYPNQRDPQREWDLVVANMDAISPTDHAVFQDTLIVLLTSTEDDVREMAMAKLPAFLATPAGHDAADAIAMSLEEGISRTEVRSLDALEILLDSPSTPTHRIQSIFDRITTSLLPYAASRPKGLSTLCMVSWDADMQSKVITQLDLYASELNAEQLIYFSAQLRPHVAPVGLAAALEKVATSALTAGDTLTASKAIGNLSVDLTARIALSTDHDVTEPLASWLSAMDDQERAFAAPFKAVIQAAHNEERFARVLETYKAANGTAFNDQVLMLANDEIFAHDLAIGSTGWPLVLKVSNEDTLRRVVNLIIEAWKGGAASDVLASQRIAESAAANPVADALLAEEIVPALRRWTIDAPDEGAARTLGAVARLGKHLLIAARRELNRPGPRKDASSRGAFRQAKRALGLKV
ncbi:P-loop NTPase fold protein [Clavibacter michiganensis]|uniref:P-loop NTPase fold protein n=1 Tax=Clavibacter michiganensis TaxID=28447 RepID=UPI003DA050FC